MKNKNRLVLAIFFLVLSILSFTFIHPTEESCITKPYPWENIISMVVGIIFIGTSFLFFRDYFVNLEEKLNIVGFIPARMASTRFPGKPLAKINGIPMIEHVYLNAKQCKTLKKVYIVTPDKEIKDYMEQGTAEVIMTSPYHERATDRITEALEIIEKETKQQIDIIVMIQGDEPMVTPEMIDESLQPLLKGESKVSNLMYLIFMEKDKQDKNTIKVVTDKDNNALYFSRSVIPNTNNNAFEFFKQVCVIAFTRDMLLKFSQLSPTPLEKAESVDMLRFLEHGFKVKMVRTRTSTHSVDTLEDLKLVESLLNIKAIENE